MVKCKIINMAFLIFKFFFRSNGLVNQRKRRLSRTERSIKKIPLKIDFSQRIKMNFSKNGKPIFDHLIRVRTEILFIWLRFWSINFK